MGQILLNRRFDTFQELALTAHQWDVDFVQIDKGHFSAQLTQILSKELLFTRARINRKLDQSGSAPAGMWSFAITALSNSALIFKKRKVMGNHLMIYPPGSEINAVSQSPFDILSFSVPDLTLELLASKRRFPILKKLIGNTEALICQKCDMDILRSLLIHLFSQANFNEPLTADSNLIDRLTDDILGAIFRAIYRNDAQSVIPVIVRNREKAFDSAKKHIRMSCGNPLTVKELVWKTGVSQRTLEYIFQERLGMTPKQYILAYRLNRVKTALQTSSGRSQVKIVDIANQWGFWHMGQFAKDYKQLFHELPSKTLQLRKLQDEKPHL